MEIFPKVPGISRKAESREECGALKNILEKETNGTSGGKKVGEG